MTSFGHEPLWCVMCRHWDFFL